ncbi:hypothetical protein PLICRDRAFT_57286 [Plicaturopsis crispa FD-325 SS-3]|uniref:Protein CPL1-like domain-containing protein n=1 Tax=Plicaturopsis crispa FD-325 SS-3 TaxID=944288 RepID=A0A0C9SL29_PLICR|nr:hypothetical protein PLICRDRAFT_57286 [Plicaturopsis crispa FD-325 SS-3]
MRGFANVVLATLSVLSATGAYAQGHLGLRALEDICGNVNANLVVNGVNFGRIDSCLCFSGLRAFERTDAVASSAVNVFGPTRVVGALEALINRSPDRQDCAYPDHAVPQCTTDNLCAFTCSDGYVPAPAIPPANPTQCVCPDGMNVCNGVCTADACPSGLISGKKRDANYWARTAECPRGQSVCGVYGGSSRAWECIDTANDLESCGGCVIELNPLSGREPSGVDCTAIHGVFDVACKAGRCVVNRCMPGFEPSVDGDLCLSQYTQ